jgi:hypothetical protein
MKHFKKSKKSSVEMEPVYTNLFEVEFHSNALKKKEITLMQEQLTRLVHDHKVKNLFGLDFFKTMELTFNLNLIKNQIQPLTIVEKLEARMKAKHDVVTGRPITLDIVLKMYDKKGFVNRTLTFVNCKIISIRNNNDFNYAKPNRIDELDVTLEYEKMDVKNAKKK